MRLNHDAVPAVIAVQPGALAEHDQHGQVGYNGKFNTAIKSAVAPVIMKVVPSQTSGRRGSARSSRTSKPKPMAVAAMPTRTIVIASDLRRRSPGGEIRPDAWRHTKDHGNHKPNSESTYEQRRAVPPPDPSL